MLGLPRRLEAVASLVIPGEPVADIGTDHGLLPVALRARGIVPGVIASDLRPLPLQRAEDTVSEHGDVGGIELRLADGLAAIAPGEVGTVVLAGMGGPRIRQIVDGCPERLAGVKRIVMQPTTEWNHTRRWIGEHGWELLCEVLVEQADRFYLVVAVDPRSSTPASWNEEDLLLGPLLRRHRTPLFRQYLAREHQRLLRAAEGAKHGRNKGDHDELQRYAHIVAHELARPQPG